MTNKEYLEWQLGVANEEQDRKLIKSIIKDLEVLEILKKSMLAETCIDGYFNEDTFKGWSVPRKALTDEELSAVLDWLSR